MFIFIHLKVFSNFFYDIFLTCWLFRSELFNFHMFVSFSNFFVLFIFNFIPLYLELIFCIMSVFLSLWRCILWPSLWSVLRLSRVCLRRVYAKLLLDGTFSGCRLDVWRCWTFIWFLVLSMSSVSLLTFCLVLPVG